MTEPKALPPARISRGLNPIVRLRLQRAGIWIGLGLFLWQLGQSVDNILRARVVVQSYYPLLAAFVVGLGFNLLQMVNWRLILRGLRVDIPMRETLQKFPRTFLPRYIPGSVWGYLSRGEWLANQFNVPHRLNIYSSIIEVLIPFSAAICLLAAFFMRQNFTVFIVILFACIVLLWAMLEFFRGRLPGWLRFSGETYSFPFRRWLLGNAVFAINWVLMGIMTAALLAVFVDPLGFWNIQSIWTATLVYCAAWLGGFLVVFVPAGMGVREVLLRLLLVQALGISGEQALLVAMSARLLSLLSEGVWLAIGFFIRDR